MRTLIFKTTTGATVYQLDENTYTVGKKGDYPLILDALYKDMQSTNFIDRIMAQSLHAKLFNEKTNFIK